MESQITVNVSLSSLQWSVTRAREDKLVMVINVVERKKSIRLVGVREREGG